MHFFAATALSAHQTVALRLREVPVEFWIKIGLGILVIIATVIVLRKIAKVNKVLLAVGVFLAFTIMGFNWIYERNEPKWATPAVQWLAGFFPSKGKLEAKRHSWVPMCSQPERFS